MSSKKTTKARSLSKADDLDTWESYLGVYIKDENGPNDFIPVFRSKIPGITGFQERKQRLDSVSNRNIHKYKTDLRKVNRVNNTDYWIDANRAPKQRVTGLSNVSGNMHQLLCVLEPDFIDKLRSGHIEDLWLAYARGKPVGYGYLFDLNITHMMNRFGMDEPADEGREHSDHMTGYVLSPFLHKPILEKIIEADLFNDDMTLRLPLTNDTYYKETPTHTLRSVDISIYEAYRIFPQLHKEPAFAELDRRRQFVIC